MGRKENVDRMDGKTKFAIGLNEVGTEIMKVIYFKIKCERGHEQKREKAKNISRFD